MLDLLVKESLPEDVSQLKVAHDDGDWELTQKLAHKIKGGVVYIGATRLKMACQYLERYWKSGGRDLMEPFYQQSLVVINDSVKEIKSFNSEN